MPLAAFTEAEIALARELAAEHHVILLTDQELEPYHIYDRQPQGEGTRLYGGSFSALAQATWQLYPHRNGDEPD